MIWCCRGLSTPIPNATARHPPWPPIVKPCVPSKYMLHRDCFEKGAFAVTIFTNRGSPTPIPRECVKVVVVRTRLLVLSAAGSHKFIAVREHRGVEASRRRIRRTAPVDRSGMCAMVQRTGERRRDGGWGRRAACARSWRLRKTVPVCSAYAARARTRESYC